MVWMEPEQPGASCLHAGVKVNSTLATAPEKSTTGVTMGLFSQGLKVRYVPSLV